MTQTSPKVMLTMVAQAIQSSVISVSSCKETLPGKLPEDRQLRKIMIEDRIQNIEARLKDSAHIPEAKREELLKLLAALKDEVASLPSTHAEDARSVAKFMDASAHEATRSEKRPKQIEAAQNGLTASVEAFEASHPKLAEVVNQIAVALSNMGL